MQKLKDSLPYVAAFVLVVGGLAFATSWQELDWWFFSVLAHDEAPVISNEVMIVDVLYNKNPEVYRKSVCRALDALANRPDERPKAVALDVAIGDDPRSLGLLKTCIARLQARGIKMYAAVNPLDKSGSVDPRFLDEHAQEVYRDLLHGYGHTLLEHKYGVVKYDPYLELGDGRSLPALPITIAEQEYARPMARAQLPIVLRVGDTQKVAEITVKLDATGLRGFQGKVVIVASPAADVSELGARSGPELLAWAISERILPADSAGPKILADWRVLLASIAVFSLVAQLSFVGLLALRRSPWIDMPVGLIAMASCGVSVLSLVLFVWGLRGLAYLYPQLSLVLAGIVLSSGLGWLKEQREAQWVDLKRLVRPPRAVYDVFISYSRAPDNAKWVEENVYKPLAELRKPDGSGLRIFFDRESIKQGMRWFREMARAIATSRVFVPVYSEDYFEKPFCQFEMERAVIKAIKQKRECVLPVARVVTGIPEEYDQYDHLTWLDVTRPDFARELQERVMAKATLNAGSPAEPPGAR